MFHVGSEKLPEAVLVTTHPLHSTGEIAGVGSAKAKGIAMKTDQFMSESMNFMGGSPFSARSAGPEWLRGTPTTTLGEQCGPRQVDDAI